jgi:hypothetical protein
MALAGFALYQAYGTAGTASTGTVFQDAFDGEGGWPRAATSAGTARYYKGGYLLQPLPEQGMAATAPVAADRMAGVRVSATARMQVGSGAVGVTALSRPGAPHGATARYETFSVRRLPE